VCVGVNEYVCVEDCVNSSTRIRVERGCKCLGVVRVNENFFLNLSGVALDRNVASAARPRGCLFGKKAVKER
jgi:hypothetical protein